MIKDYNPQYAYSDFQIFYVQLKCYYLQKLYSKVFQYCNDITDFNTIAKLALVDANNSFGLYSSLSNNNGFTAITNPKTMLLWFRLFCENDSFPNANKTQHKSQLPFFLLQNPDAYKAILSYFRSNLSTLTVESVHHHIHEKVIPKLVEKVRNKQNNQDYNCEDLKKEFRVQKLTIQTVYNWMIRIGFKYQPRKKSYYVDTHESPENASYRVSFIKQNFEYELKSHCWISIPVSEAEEMAEKGELELELGYRYTKDEKEYIEFHIDDHLKFQLIGDTLPYGGFLSVRILPNCKPLIVGQDKCIFKQYIFSKGVWVLPDGTKQLIPKEEGQGVMLSSFCCRELGYGYPVQGYILGQVNKKRENETYSDEIAAREYLGTTKKQPLTSTPFVRELEYRKNHDGYWTYNCMII